MAERADGDGGRPLVPQPWTYDIAKVLDDRRRIRAAVAAVFPEGSTCSGTDFTRLVAVVAACLPARVCQYTLHDSLWYLAGEKLTFALVDQMAWRIAGNVNRLARQRLVPPWAGQAFPEWVPVQITAARRRRGGRRNESGYLFTFQILAGAPCPLVTQRFWSDRVCQFISAHMGFSRPRFSSKSTAPARLAYRHPTELVTLRMFALIEPRLSGAAGPGFEHTKVPGSCIEWNREQFRHRDRLPVLVDRATGATRDYVCPRNYPYEFPCYRCPAGFEECRAGTHRLTYEQRPCKLCGRPTAPFDMELATEICVDCYNRRAVSRSQ